MTVDLWALSSACATGKKLAKVKALGLVPTSACALVHWLVSASVALSGIRWAYQWVAKLALVWARLSVVGPPRRRRS